MDKQLYLTQVHRQFGSANPTRMDLQFWREMVTTGELPYAAREKLGVEMLEGGAVWCFQRFGSTRTPLPDGRVVCIAGEHEDHYDPDFCIYNDVIVVEPSGDFHIYGYPKEVFPPTDFHTATLTGDRILIVGSLGYSNERGTETPVYSLNLSTFSISRLEPLGTSPGWISRHHATLLDDGRTLHLTGKEPVEDEEPDSGSCHPWRGTAELDLKTLTWQPRARPARPQPVPELDARLLTRRWKPVKPCYQDYESHNLKCEVPPGHPLFACNVMPWAQAPNYQIVYRLLDGTGRLALVELEDLHHHAQLPKPTTTFFHDVEAIVHAVESADL